MRVCLNSDHFLHSLSFCMQCLDCQGEGQFQTMNDPQCQCLTFNGDNVFPNLVLQEGLFHPFQEFINRINVGMDRLEPLDFRSDSGRICKVLLIVHRSDEIRSCTLNVSVQWLLSVYLRVFTPAFAVQFYHRASNLLIFNGAETS